MEDVTWFLKKYSYWPSYNVPFIKEITRVAGFSEKVTYSCRGTETAECFGRDWT